MTDQISVYLLDDHEIVRRGLRELLAATDDIVVVGESGLAEEAVRRIPALRPDVAIFDAQLRDGSGIDACRRVRSVDPTIRVSTSSRPRSGPGGGEAASRPTRGCGRSPRRSGWCWRTSPRA
jgi:DNA-binding NarL/FixJ family response regulator